MKYTTLLLLAISLLSISTFSQPDTTNTHKTGWIIKSGERNFTFKALNSAFNNAGVAQLNNRVFGYSIGIASRSITKHTYGTATLSYLSANNHEMQPRPLLSSIDIIELALNYHFALNNDSEWLVLPYFGYGVGYGSMLIINNDQNATFAQSVTNLTQNDGFKKRYNMEQLYAFANIGLGLERGIRIACYQLFIGFSSGYQLTTKSGWGYPDLPSIRYGGLEWRVSVRVEPNFRTKYD